MQDSNKFLEAVCFINNKKTWIFLIYFILKNNFVKEKKDQILLGWWIDPLHSKSV